LNPEVNSRKFLGFLIIINKDWVFLVEPIFFFFIQNWFAYKGIMLSEVVSYSPPKSDFNWINGINQNKKLVLI
jgi:hypothetical protein